MEFRRATYADVPQIVVLQDHNLEWVLGPQNLGEGFLSTRFSESDFETMCDELGIVLAVVKDRVVGYLCLTTLHFNRRFPLPAAMLEGCEHLVYAGRPLSEYCRFVSTPMCIDREYRGTRVYAGLVQEGIAMTVADYDIALAFVSERNHRQLKSVQKAGATLLAPFDGPNDRFWIMVHPLRQMIPIRNRVDRSPTT